MYSKQCQSQKSPGYDGVRMRDLIVHFDRLKTILLYIINETFTTGHIHRHMKISLIRPLHKKGSKRGFNNYRPIAILSAIACIMEKIVHACMMSFCDKYHLLNPAQYGFRKGKSTISLLEDFHDLICKEIDKNNIALTLFICKKRLILLTIIYY